MQRKQFFAPMPTSQNLFPISPQKVRHFEARIWLIYGAHRFVHAWRTWFYRQPRLHIRLCPIPRTARFVFLLLLFFKSLNTFLSFPCRLLRRYSNTVKIHSFTIPWYKSRTLRDNVVVRVASQLFSKFPYLETRSRHCFYQFWWVLLYLLCFSSTKWWPWIAWPNMKQLCKVLNVESSIYSTQLNGRCTQRE